MQKIIQDLKDENKNLKEENKKSKKEKKNLEEKIDDLKYKIEEILTKNPDIKKIEEKYKQIIEEKDLKIEMLKSRLSDIIDDLKEGEKLVAINFKSNNDSIYLPVVCKNKTAFKDVENQLYIQYPKYKNNKNFFIYNGFKIDKSNNSKKLEEIGIHGYTI